MSIVFQISDCHLSDETSCYNFERALVEVRYNAAIFLTGDLVCGPKPEIIQSSVALLTSTLRTNPFMRLRVIMMTSI